MFARSVRRIAPLVAGSTAVVLLPQWFSQQRNEAAADGVFGGSTKSASSGIQPIKCEDGTSVLPWSAPTRVDTLSRLQKEEFDVVIIGGGCVGAGCAWEAATRGLKVALVERDDFSAGTSGRSTKLIHGGIRYLESAVKNFDLEMYHLVEEALAERAHLLHAAPYMAHPLATLIPLYTWWEVPYMWLGVKVYDLIAGSRRMVPDSYYISRDEALYQFPMLKSDGLKGGIVYYDGQHNDTRMNLMIALTAAQRGAAVGNYLSVQSIVKDASGKACGVVVQDVEEGSSGTGSGSTFTIKARAVINATGCFGDAIRKMDDPAAQDLILGAAGVHVILPDHFSPDNMGLIVPRTKDGRVLFFLPWEGSTICGTTDSPSDISMNPRPTEEDVSFIIEESSRYLNRPIKREDVKAAWSGIRPLIKDPAKLSSGAASSQLSRSHVVTTSASGMVSILGGKWTTYRRMAEEAVDAVGKVHPSLPIGPSVTLNMQLLGADRAGIVFNQKYDRIPITLRETYGFDKDVAKHLSMNYGTRALQVAEIARRDPALAARLSPRYPLLKAEVVFSCQQEYALTAVDVLARRTRLAFLNKAAAEEVLPSIIALMAKERKWSHSRQQKETAAAHEFLKTMI